MPEGMRAGGKGVPVQAPPSPQGPIYLASHGPGKPLLIWEPKTLQSEALPLIPVLKLGPDPHGMSP